VIDRGTIYVMEHGTIYVMDRGTIMCDQSWYDQSDRSWYNHVMDRGMIYISPSNYHLIVNVSINYQLCQCHPPNYQKMSMFPLMTKIPFIKLLKLGLNSLYTPMLYNLYFLPPQFYFLPNLVPVVYEKTKMVPPSNFPSKTNVQSRHPTGVGVHARHLSP
jgi:hypothetical protein